MRAQKAWPHAMSAKHVEEPQQMVARTLTRLQMGAKKRRPLKIDELNKRSQDMGGVQAAARKMERQLKRAQDVGLGQQEMGQLETGQLETGQLEMGQLEMGQPSKGTRKTSPQKVGTVRHPEQAQNW